MTRLGRDLLVPAPVAVEVDQLLRGRVGGESARAFLAALAAGEHSIAFLTRGLLARSVEIDTGFAHFRATRPVSGFWRLVVDETRYAEATSIA